jgi:hypothetical protein
MCVGVGPIPGGERRYGTAVGVTRAPGVTVAVGKALNWIEKLPLTGEQQTTPEPAPVCVPEYVPEIVVPEIVPEPVAVPEQGFPRVRLKETLLFEMVPVNVPRLGMVAVKEQPLCEIVVKSVPERPQESLQKELRDPAMFVHPPPPPPGVGVGQGALGGQFFSPQAERTKSEAIAPAEAIFERTRFILRPRTASADSRHRSFCALSVPCPSTLHDTETPQDSSSLLFRVPPLALRRGSRRDHVRRGGASATLVAFSAASQSRRASASFRAAGEGFVSRNRSKYLPDTPSSSGSAASRATGAAPFAEEGSRTPRIQGIGGGAARQMFVAITPG